MSLRLIDGEGTEKTREAIKNVMAEVAGMVDGGEVDGLLLLVLHADGFSAYAANVSEQEMVWLMERHKAVIFKG